MWRGVAWQPHSVTGLGSGEAYGSKSGVDISVRNIFAAGGGLLFV